MTKLDNSFFFILEVPFVVVFVKGKFQCNRNLALILKLVKF